MNLKDRIALYKQRQEHRKLSTRFKESLAWTYCRLYGRESWAMLGKEATDESLPFFLKRQAE